MEDEIKVGEYVRTVDGYIRKVTQVNKKGSYECLCYGAYSVDERYKNSIGISAKKIKAHSKNIIDLIEVGDYVNGEKVLSADWGGVGIANFKFIEPEDIKSIITKEQIKQIEYRIKE